VQAVLAKDGDRNDLKAAVGPSSLWATSRPIQYIKIVTGCAGFRFGVRYEQVLKAGGDRHRRRQQYRPHSPGSVSLCGTARGAQAERFRFTMASQHIKILDCISE